MVGKDKGGIKGSSNKRNVRESIDFEYVVSEGSVVVLNARDLIKDVDTTKSIKNYSWTQTTGMHLGIDDNIKNNPILSFPAPYVDGDNPNSTFGFELTITDKDGKTRDSPYNANVIVKRIQRAMIFQGGVAIGAYEAGVFQALVKKIGEEQRRLGLENKRPLFDIVAGASIGAWNAAVVVSNTIESKRWKHSAEELVSWQHSAEKLVRFWKYQKSCTWADILDMNPLYRLWWDTMHNTQNALKSSYSDMWDFISKANPYLKNWYDELTRTFFWLEPDFWKDHFIDGWYIPATGEAVRRYYSAYQCEHLGALHVATGILPMPWSAYGKFYDMSDRSSFAFPRSAIPRPDNKHWLPFSLSQTLKEFADFPIGTQMPNPRFLLVSIDVQTGDVVTFDSYEKNNSDGNNLTKYYSEYGDEQNKHTIFYENGIEDQHVMASGAFPNLFDYPKFNVKDSQTSLENKKHIFWDGNLRSSTPLREVIQAHRDYWYKTRNEAHVPDLEVYIADLWPSLLKEEPTSFDLDFVDNRKWNIIFNDKTDYDEQVANVVTDLTDVVRELSNLAKIKGASTDEIDSILKKPALSEKRNGQARSYGDLLLGRFRLTKVVRIDRKDDGNEVFDMLFDYSSTSVENLMRDGCRDAHIQSLREGLKAIKSKTGNEDDKIEELESYIQEIEKGINVENIYDRQIEDFTRTVQSLPDEVGYNGSIEEEKAVLVHAAKQFREIITEAHAGCVHARV